MKIIKNLSMFLALAIVLVSFSCSKWEEPGGGGGNGGGGKPVTYTLNGTFTDYSKLDGCKWVFESKEAKKYELNQWLSKEPIKAGVQAEIEVKYNNVATVCMVGQSMDVLSVKYATSSDPTNCKPISKLNNSAVFNTVTILKAWQEGNYLKMLLGYSGCNFDPKPIDLYWDGYITKTNPSSVTLKLINQPKAQNCTAYFTSEACFDISAFKGIGSTVILQIEGYKEGSVMVVFK